MVRPSSYGASPEDWRSYLAYKGSPQKIDKALLSLYLTSTEKASIIEVIPAFVAKKSIEMHQLESKLEDAGHDFLAQLIRREMFSVLAEDIQTQHRQWAQRVVVIDIECRWIVQREAYLQEETQALTKSLMLSDDADKKHLHPELEHELQTYETELEHLNGLYWKYIRLHGELKGSILHGVFTRAFRQHRKNPGWYLSKDLREDCIRRGGCCGRSCGCFEKDRSKNIQQRLWRRGHCTTACGCCVRTQKSKKDFIAMQKDVGDFPFDFSALVTPYSQRMYLAYLWGLGVGDGY